MTQMVIGVTPLYDVQRDSVWMIPGYLDGITQAGPNSCISCLTWWTVSCLPADRM